MKWYLHVLKNYANFNGRAQRKELWMFILFNMIFGLAAILLDNGMGFTFGASGYGFLYSIYALAVFIPGLAVTVRRLHDVGKSGWFYLIIFIPIIGAIWLLVLMCTIGEYDENEYGPNPADLELGTEMQ